MGWPSEYKQLYNRLKEINASLKSEECLSIANLGRKGSRLLNYAISKRIPLIGTIEITHKCNLRCSHCYILHKIKNPDIQSLDIGKTKDIIRQLSTLGCIDLRITGGEPTLHSDVLSFIQEARSLHMYTVFKSNGTTFSNELFSKDYAKDPAHETHISIYGSNPETHDRFTNTRNSFSRTMKGLGNLAEHGILCTVVCTVWKGNVNQLKSIKKLINEMGHKIIFDAVITGRTNCDAVPLRLKISVKDRMKLEQEGYLKPFNVSQCTAGRNKIKYSDKRPLQH